MILTLYNNPTISAKGYLIFRINIMYFFVAIVLIAKHRVQFQVISYEIHGGWCGTGANFLRVSKVILCRPSFHCYFILSSHGSHRPLGCAIALTALTKEHIIASWVFKVRASLLAGTWLQSMEVSFCKRNAVLACTYIKLRSCFVHYIGCNYIQIPVRKHGIFLKLHMSLEEQALREND
jgi:hypothetical protein